LVCLKNDDWWEFAGGDVDVVVSVTTTTNITRHTSHVTRHTSPSCTVPPVSAAAARSQPRSAHTCETHRRRHCNNKNTMTIELHTSTHTSRTYKETYTNMQTHIPVHTHTHEHTHHTRTHTHTHIAAAHMTASPVSASPAS